MCEFFSIEKKRAQGIGFCKILKIFFIFPSEKNQKSFRDNCFWFWFNKITRNASFRKKKLVSGGDFRKGCDEFQTMTYLQFRICFSLFLVYVYEGTQTEYFASCIPQGNGRLKGKNQNRNVFSAHRAVFQERAPKDDYKFTRLVDKWIYGNDPSAGSPTETLLRLLLPLNDQV